MYEKIAEASKPSADLANAVIKLNAELVKQNELIQAAKAKREAENTEHRVAPWTSNNYLVLHKILKGTLKTTEELLDSLLTDTQKNKFDWESLKELD